LAPPLQSVLVLVAAEEKVDETDAEESEADHVKAEV